MVTKLTTVVASREAMIPIDFQVTMLTSNCWSSFKCRPVIFFEQLAGYLPKTVCTVVATRDEIFRSREQGQGQFG